MASFRVAGFFEVAVVVLCLCSGAAAQGLAVGFYGTSCPTVETIIADSMRTSFNSDSTVLLAFYVSPSMTALFV